MLPEPIAEAVDQGRERVDGQPPPRRGGALPRVGREVQHRELPEPDGVVGDDVGDGCARDLGPDPAELRGDLLVGELLVVVVVVEVIELGVAGGTGGSARLRPSSGTCSPDGVHKPLTLVSSPLDNDVGSGVVRPCSETGAEPGARERA